MASDDDHTPAPSLDHSAVSAPPAQVPAIPTLDPDGVPYKHPPPKSPAGPILVEVATAKVPPPGPGLSKAAVSALQEEWRLNAQAVIRTVPSPEFGEFGPVPAAESAHLPPKEGPKAPPMGPWPYAVREVYDRMAEGYVPMAVPVKAPSINVTWAWPAKAPPDLTKAPPIVTNPYKAPPPTAKAPAESAPAKAQPPKTHTAGGQDQSAESALAKTPPPTDQPPDAENYALDEHGEVATTYSQMTDEDIYDTVWGRRLYQSQCRHLRDPSHK